MLTIDWQRAELICGQLLAALRKNVYPYNAPRPQDFIPPALRKNRLTHARFLFYACHYMRGTIRSDFAFKRLIGLWEVHPKLFEPSQVRRVGQLELYRELREALFYQASEISSFWLENSRRLSKHWKGDPRRIFFGINEPEEMYRRIVNKGHNKNGRKEAVVPHEEGFLGFQEKMSSMLAYFLMEAELIPEFRASPAVDFHLLRILLATEILVPKDRNKKIRYEHVSVLGIQVLEWYSKKFDVSLVEVGDALWLVSTTLCRRAPGNAMFDRHKNEEAGIRNSPQPLVLDWRKANHVRRYVTTCGSCPVGGQCSWHVFSGTYYEEGEFAMRAHERPPILFPQLPRHLRERPPTAKFEGESEDRGTLSLFETPGE